MKKIIFTAVVFCFVSAFVFSLTPATRRFPIPGHGTLLLQVPQVWKAGLLQPPDNLPPTIAFTSSSGALFKVLVTAGWVKTPGARPPDADTLEKQVELAAKSAEPQAVEKLLTVKELTGPAIHGFYFSATDKAPKAGEYKYLTQGIAGVEDVLLAFTILTNDGQEAVVKAALGMLRGAVLQPESGVKN
jgi:hypothetical protein